MNARKKNKGSPSPVAPDVMLDRDELRRRTAEKAYSRYLSRDRAPGRDLEDWLEAERLVRKEMAAPAQRSTARRATTPAP